MWVKREHTRCREVGDGGKKKSGKKRKIWYLFASFKYIPK
jgi:hypothetical protein